MTDCLEFKFGSVKIYLPKEEPKEAWEMAKRIMKVYFEKEK